MHLPNLVAARAGREEQDGIAVVAAIFVCMCGGGGSCVEKNELIIYKLKIQKRVKNRYAQTGLLSAT